MGKDVPIPSSYLWPLSEAMKMLARPDNAAPMARYMRDQFPFLGLKSPERKTVLRDFFKMNGLPADYRVVVREMWDLLPREWHYNAIELGAKCKNQWQPEEWRLFEWCILSKSWWDTVDAISTEWVAPFFERYPEQKQAVTNRWLSSDNLWLRRTVIIFQRRLKEKTDVALLARSIAENATSEVFFLQKAIGWALRSYAATDPTFVSEFLKINPLMPLSKREALKGINRQTP
ncbi:MAG: DNA alkylation repair protein [Bacteroidetes Order II. Incertae sedis bacterium]|nr:DNA alkylation repair protein [Bacteroidetes Order II. bacterium]